MRIHTCTRLYVCSVHVYTNTVNPFRPTRRRHAIAIELSRENRDANQWMLPVVVILWPLSVVVQVGAFVVFIVGIVDTAVFVSMANNC